MATAAASLVVVCTAALFTIVLAQLGSRVVDGWTSGESEPSSLALALVATAVVGVFGVAFLHRLIIPAKRGRSLGLVPHRVATELDRIHEVSVFGVGSLTSWTATNPSANITEVRKPPPLEAVHHLFRLSDEKASADSLNASLASNTAAQVSESGQEAVDTQVPAVPPPNYVVGRGDTYWSLAAALLGDGSRWAEIRQLNLNRVVEPGVEIESDTNLRRGWQIAVPESVEKSDK